MKICKHPGCIKPVHAHGLCTSHVYQLKAHGETSDLRTSDPAARFLEKVDKESGPVHPTYGKCWLWTGQKSPQGYGAVRWRGKMRKATRVALEIAGMPIADEQQALHHCDNPPCVRPDHLFPGDNDLNVADKVAKGRQIKGESAMSAKLTEEQVEQIRALRRSGSSARAIGRAFNLSGAHVARVCRGRFWKHLGPEDIQIRPGRLTEDQVNEMRALCAGGVSAAEIGRRFQISGAHASRVCRGLYWRPSNAA